MRVTHVITRLIVGGAQENTVASVLGLRTKPGLHVDLISGPSSGPEGTLESCFDDCRDHLRIIPELVRPVRIRQDRQALRRLTDIFRAERPDLVHTHSGKAGIIGRLAAARAGVPLVVHTIHGPSFGAFQGWLPNLVFRAAERRAGRVTTHFVVVAGAMRDQYLAAGIGRPEQYTHVASGFNLAPFLAANNDLALRARLGIEPGDFVIGKVARLFKLKGHDDLFDIAPAVLARCPRARFLLIGDGPWRERFIARAQDLGLVDRFIFAGLVPPGSVAQYVGIMDVLVHLSRREGLPRALPQAMAAGKPVLAYDCDGAREVCIDGQTGYLLAPGDSTTLLARLALLAGDPALRQRLGDAGRNFVRSRFTVEKMVDDLYDLYGRLSRGLRRDIPGPAGQGQR